VIADWDLAALHDDDGWLIGYRCRHLQDEAYPRQDVWSRWQTDGNGHHWLLLICESCYRDRRLARWQRRRDRRSPARDDVSSRVRKERL
jgi:hypothetical protein